MVWCVYHIITQLKSIQMYFSINGGLCPIAFLSGLSRYNVKATSPSISKTITTTNTPKTTLGVETII